MESYGKLPEEQTTKQDQLKENRLWENIWGKNKKERGLSSPFHQMILNECCSFDFQETFKKDKGGKQNQSLFGKTIFPVKKDKPLFQSSLSFSLPTTFSLELPKAKFFPLQESDDNPMNMAQNYFEPQDVQTPLRKEPDFVKKIRSSTKPNKPSGKKKILLEDSDQIKECGICLDQMKVNEHVFQLKCQHIFHEKCLNSWFEKNKVCPYCRRAI